MKKSQYIMHLIPGDTFKQKLIHEKILVASINIFSITHVQDPILIVF